MRYAVSKAMAGLPLHGTDWPALAADAAELLEAAAAARARMGTYVSDAATAGLAARGMVQLRKAEQLLRPISETAAQGCYGPYRPETLAYEVAAAVGQLRAARLCLRQLGAKKQAEGNLQKN